MGKKNPKLRKYYFMRKKSYFIVFSLCSFLTLTYFLPIKKSAKESKEQGGK